MSKWERDERELWKWGKYGVEGPQGLKGKEFIPTGKVGSGEQPQKQLKDLSKSRSVGAKGASLQQTILTRAVESISPANILRGLMPVLARTGLGAFGSLLMNPGVLGEKENGDKEQRLQIEPGQYPNPNDDSTRDMLNEQAPDERGGRAKPRTARESQQRYGRRGY